jgi:hypothetical protein
MYRDLGLAFFAFAVLAGLRIKPVYSWSAYNSPPEPASSFQTTLAKLGYEDKF